VPAERVAKADRGTVVIVKDDHHIADLVDLWLRNAGFRVLQAAEARRGIFAFQRRLADSGSSCLQGFPAPVRHVRASLLKEIARALCGTRESA
jgi:hypothetical protein